MCCDNKKCLSFWNRMIISAGFVTILYIAMAAVFKIQWRYGVNDDSLMMLFVSGMNTGEPVSYLQWSRFLYSGLVALMYRLTPGIPWYILFYIFFEWLSLVTFVNVLMKKLHTQTGIVCGLGIFVTIYLRLLLVESVRPQFTTLGGLCAGAAIMLFLAMKSDDEKSEKVMSSVILVLLLFAAINLRYETSIIVAALGVATLGLTFVRNDFSIKKIIVPVVVFGAMFLGAYAADKVYTVAFDWQDGHAFMNARGEFIDYATMTYDENPQAYDEIGWDDTLDVMSRDWFFMDENVTTDNFLTIAEFSKQKVDRSLKAAVRRGVSYLLADKMVLIMFMSWGACCAWALLISIGNKKRFFSAIGMTGYYVACMMFLGALFYLGRYPQRVVDMIVMMTLLPSVAEGIDHFKMLEETDNKHELSKEFLRALELSFFMVLLAGAVIPDGKDESQFLYDRTDEFVEYVKANPDKIFVKDTDIAQIYSPFTTQPFGTTKNLICWGEGFYNTPPYFAQINANGYEKMTSENFFDDNVYVVRFAPPSEESAFMKYMRKRWPMLEYEIVEAQEYFTVIKFRK